MMGVITLESMVTNVSILYPVYLTLGYSFGSSRMACWAMKDISYNTIKQKSCRPEESKL